MIERVGRSAILALVVSIAIAVPLAHSTDVTDARAPRTEKQGYWWNDTPPAPFEEGVAHPELGPPPNAEELSKLHPKDLEKMIEDYREYALWKMSPETVRWYFEMQDAARVRARAFMNVTGLVMLENPQLNMHTVYPTNPAGEQARITQRTRVIGEKLATAAGRAALVMLSREGCEYCEAQRGILQHFATKHGWDVRELDLDRHPQAALRFGTQFVPTTILIFRDQPVWQPVSVGVETVENVEEGVYSALRYVSGEVAPEQYTLKEFQDGGIQDPLRRPK
jgi:conjugal transfer pilus assembly protein TraF